MKCGHMLTGIALGLKIQKLSIMPIGFSISFKIDTKNYNKKILKANLLTIKKLIIYFAGPITNLLLIAFFSIIGKEKIFSIESKMMIYSNILIFIFNMIPIYPLDGGRILKNILHTLFGKIVAMNVTNNISNIVAIIFSIFCIYLIAISKNPAYIFILIYIWIICINENKKYNIKRKIYKSIAKCDEIW